LQGASASFRNHSPRYRGVMDDPLKAVKERVSFYESAAEVNRDAVRPVVEVRLVHTT